MRIHYIIHAPFEGLGAIHHWITKHNYKSSGTHTYRGEKLPDASEFDMLIIMGGPQSPLKLDKYPYLRDEIALAQKAIQHNLPVLGICLGAQIIGESLGAKTEQSPNKEVGVYPVDMTNEAETDPLFKLFPKQFDVMHWHNDMPGMADGCVLLARSAGCPRQAFRYGDRVYGYQFHLEMTPENVNEMVKHCREDLKPSQYVQPADELAQINLMPINQKLEMTLDYLASFVTNK